MAHVPRVSLIDGTVTEAGDTPLWSDVEWAYAQWTAAGGRAVGPAGSHGQF
jgi:hypothetical protein